MRVNGPWHLSGAPRIADPGSEVDKTGAAEWEGISPGGFSRICPKVALAGMSLDGGVTSHGSAVVQISMWSPSPPLQRSDLFRLFCLCLPHIPRESDSHFRSSQGGISEAVVELAMGACISTPCGRLQGPRVRDKAASQNTGIGSCLYKRTSMTRVSIREWHQPARVLRS